MYINKISNTNFESKTPKKRFIPKDMQTSLHSLLLKMNNEIKTVQEGDYYKSTIITKLHFNKGVVFEDERRLTEKVPFEQQMQGFSNLRIGKKIVLDIDNETGELIDYQKPFYKPLSLVLKKAGNMLASIRTNFNLSEAVKKERLTINTLTSEGHKKMKKFVLQTEKERLEKVVKELEEDSK